MFTPKESNLFYSNWILFFLILIFTFSQLPANAQYQTDTTIKKKFTVNKIQLLGNKTTKNHILLRELIFKENDELLASEIPEIIKKTKENLKNTSLFNFVDIDTSLINQNKINFTINVVERWYVWPIPFMALAERNFNVFFQNPNPERFVYGAFLDWQNFRGRKEWLKIMIKTGYDEQYGFFYSKPYLDKKQMHGLTASFVYSRKHEVNYATINNKPVYYRDKGSYSLQEYTAYLQYLFRQGIHLNHTLQLTFNKANISDSVKFYNRNYFHNDYTTKQYLVLSYKFKLDYRDFKAYPLDGFYFDAEVAKFGMGVLSNDNTDFFYVKSLIRKYVPLSKRFYWASSLDMKLSNTAFQPYYLQRGLGYDNEFVRAYEYYVVDGQSFALAKSNFKFALVPDRTGHIKWLKNEKIGKYHYAFYLNLLADAGYVHDHQFEIKNSLTNTWLFGGGVGLDFVTYYDKIMRFEYSINHLGERGFYISFFAPI